MTQINLLPWREQARQVKKIRFLVLLGIGISFAILAIALLHLFMSRLIGKQEAINTFLENQLTREKAVVTSLIKQKKEKEKILSELHYAYALQQESIKTVNLLNVLTHNIPDGVTLMKITKTTNKIDLVGRAQSTLGVTAFMNNIEKTNQFNQPVLKKISGNETKNTSASAHFNVMFQIDLVQKE